MNMAKENAIFLAGVIVGWITLLSFMMIEGSSPAHLDRQLNEARTAYCTVVLVHASPSDSLMIYRTRAEWCRLPRQEK